MTTRHRSPVVGTIAGSDSSGSSGIQADLATFAALGVHATTVVTVITAQNSLGVQAFYELPTSLIAAQLDALLDDLPPVATKTGLLRSPGVLDLVTAAASTRRLGALVVDPVLVDSSGKSIVDPALIEQYRTLAAHATVLTPNRWEAELLIGRTLDDTDAVLAAAPALAALGAELVVVTGGRTDATVVVDVAISRTQVELIEAPRIGDEPIRGTGCTFAAAMVAFLAHGWAPVDAAVAASAFVDGQLAQTMDLRPGSGRPGIPHVWVPPRSDTGPK